VALLSYVVSLPRAATPLDRPRGLHGQLLAYTNETAYLLANDKKELVVASLPMFRVRARLKLGATPTSVAWDGKRLLIALGVYKNGWALLEGDKWVVPPTWPGSDHLSVFRDARAGSLVLASMGRFQRAGSESVRPLSLWTVGKNGRLGAPTSMQILNATSDTVCGARDALYLAFQVPGKVCRIAGANENGFRSCKPVPGARLQCPNIVSLGAPSELVAGDGRRPFVNPPKRLVEGHMPSEYSFRLVPGGRSFPQASWFSSRHGVVTPLQTGFASANLDDNTRENDRLGNNQPDHVELKLWNARGVATGASRRVFGQHFDPDLLLARGDELDAYFFVGKAVARFRASDLQRLDAQDTIWAVRERLAPWGGRSWLFEALLGAVLGLGPLFFAALAFVRRPGRWRGWTTAAYLIPAAIVLYWSARRIWWF